MSEQHAKNDVPQVEWIVALRMPPHGAGGLSLHQCSSCFALVVEDFMADHEEWHVRANPPVESSPERVCPSCANRWADRMVDCPMCGTVGSVIPPAQGDES